MNLIREITIWLKALLLAAKAVIRNEIYMVRTKAMGDVLWAEPVARKLAARNQKIYFITDFPEVFQNFPFANVHFVLNKDKKYKRAAKLLYGIGAKKHVVYLTNAYEDDQNIHFLHAYQLAAGLPAEDDYPKLYISKEEENKYKYLQPYAVIHLESTSVLKHRHVHGIVWENIFMYLQNKKITPYIIAKNPTPAQLPYHIETAGLRDMIALVYNAKIFIGLDSGPSHIAASLNVPAIVFFGSINPWFRHFKKMFNGIVMQQPCEFANCYHRPQKKKKDYSCLLAGAAGELTCCAFNDEQLLTKIEVLLQQIAQENVAVKY